MNVPALNQDSPVPLHYQLRLALMEKIRNDGLRVGDRVWSEKEVEAEFGISRTTVRQALSDMVAMGIVRRERGRGTTLVRPPIPERLPHLVGLTEEMRARGSELRTEVIGASWVEPSPVVRQALHLAGASQRVLLLVRCRHIDHEPVFYVREYVPAWLGLTPDDDFTGSLFELMRERAKVVVARAEMTIGAVAAHGQVATCLKVPEGSPLLRNERVFFGADNSHVGFLEEWCRSDRYMHAVTLRAG
jgi:GntR family transcriptional regulator